MQLLDVEMVFALIKNVEDKSFPLFLFNELFRVV